MTQIDWQIRLQEYIDGGMNKDRWEMQNRESGMAVDFDGDLNKFPSAAWVITEKPKEKRIGDQTYPVPDYIEGQVYWRPNDGSPKNPAETIYTPNDDTVRYQARIGFLMATKKEAIDFAESFGHWLEKGGGE